MDLSRMEMSLVNEMLTTNHSRRGVIVDVSCPQTATFLTEVSRDEQLFNSLHHWILIQTQPNQLSSNSQQFWDSLSGVRLDSYISLINSANTSSDNVIVKDMFRIGGTRLELRIWGTEWYPNQKIPPPSDRFNYLGTTFKVAVVNAESEWDKWFDYEERHKDTMSKLAHVMLIFLGDVFNFKIVIPKEHIYPTWGFSKINGSYGGMLGAIHRHDTHLGTGCVHRKYRYDLVGYTQYYTYFCPRFIFRRPPISATNNIYLLAFSRYVWIAFTVLTFTSCVCLCLTEYFGDRTVQFENTDGWFDYFFISLSVMGLQGATSSPGKISSRMVFWSLLILAVIFDNSFSASIVVLLQSINEDIQTFTDLFYSPFRFMMHDIEYNTFYVNVTTSILEKRLFWEKLFTQPWEKAFVSIEEGVRQVRHGMVAFHADLASNKYIARTFEESEKCSLKELWMYPCEQLYLPVQKWSPYKEHFQQKLILFNEAGITDRENNLYYTAFPKCYDNGVGFMSVSIQDFKPAILFFVCGVLLACIIAIVEIIYARFKRPSRKVKKIIKQFK